MKDFYIDAWLRRSFWQLVWKLLPRSVIGFFLYRDHRFEKPRTWTDAKGRVCILKEPRLFITCYECRRIVEHRQIIVVHGGYHEYCWWCAKKEKASCR